MSEYTADMTELLTAEPETEPHIVITRDKTVIVPDELKSISTQYEKNIETVTFDCPRYWDKHDLSTMRMYINFRRADGVALPHLCGAPTVDEADESIVHFDWTVGDDVTAIKGKLSFVAVAKKADENGVLENRWASRLCQDMEILEGIEPNYAEILEPSADIIEQILYKLDTAAAVAVDAAERAIAAAQSATVVNPNLIDNWYLADPVNQRGQTEYTGAGYTIDRWKQDGTLTINDGYITHTPNEWWKAVYQPIDTKIMDALIGRKVTLSVLARSAVSGNQMRIALYDITANNMEETAAYLTTYGDLNVLSATFTVPESFAGHVVSAHLSVSTNFAGQGGSADLVAVKLEIGDKQTLAHQDVNGKWVLNDPPPDKGMELLKCQRYYQLFSSAEKRPSDKRDFRPELRTNATAANTGTIEIEGVTYYYADANL